MQIRPRERRLKLGDLGIGFLVHTGGVLHESHALHSTNQPVTNVFSSSAPCAIAFPSPCACLCEPRCRNGLLRLRALGAHGGNHGGEAIAPLCTRSRSREAVQGQAVASPTRLSRNTEVIMEFRYLRVGRASRREQRAQTTPQCDGRARTGRGDCFFYSFRPGRRCTPPGSADCSTTRGLGQRDRVRVQKRFTAHLVLMCLDSVNSFPVAPAP